MPDVIETVPSALRPASDAALAWINQAHGADFKLTGLVDAEKALASAPGEAVELGLVLCEGDRCLREQVRLVPEDGGYTVSRVPTDDPLIPPHLDPPLGARAHWVDAELAKHAFIVLLFYRGLW